MTYNGRYDSFTHYRVDRMNSVTALDQDGDPFNKSKLNIAKYSKRLFGMYDGEMVRARLSFHIVLLALCWTTSGKAQI
ncbi:WYL domain-containing protein [Eubacteriales bacterium OttesenSCG-928-K08]|nr:WYL domain-containing protein [Eubacteriales bacterium OttesenSCG-928-K08]